MQRMKYRIRFLTPAFLGNAEQSGQWRTPPFKALLRQWWRVVRAQGAGYDHRKLRETEGRLFGHAWLDDGHGKTWASRSKVRLRLDSWKNGDLRSWNGLEQETVTHPEVQRTGFKVGPHAYLGYGPFDGRGGTKLRKLNGKPNAAIQAGETSTLSIAAPESEIDVLRTALALMNAYGTVGGRSRNGWGSFMIEPFDDSPGVDASADTSRQGAGELDRSFVRPWREALALDWPHAIGADDTGPLVWRTKESCTDWKALMRDLAILKIGLRTMFVFSSARPPHDRHWLSYPITKHNFPAWGNLRLPNSLRFKVRPDPDDPKRLRGVVFHVPCLPPRDFRPDSRAIENVWRKTHQLLDELSLPNEQPRRYTMIDNDERKRALKPNLDKLTLERSPK